MTTAGFIALRVPTDSAAAFVLTPGGDRLPVVDGIVVAPIGLLGQLAAHGFVPVNMADVPPR